MNPLPSTIYPTQGLCFLFHLPGERSGPLGVLDTRSFFPGVQAFIWLRQMSFMRNMGCGVLAGGERLGCPSGERGETHREHFPTG